MKDKTRNKILEVVIVLIVLLPMGAWLWWSTITFWYWTYVAWIFE